MKRAGCVSVVNKNLTYAGGIMGVKWNLCKNFLNKNDDNSAQGLFKSKILTYAEETGKKELKL